MLNLWERRLQVTPFSKVFVIFVLLGLARTIGGHVFHVDHTDEELDAMTIESLLHVETDLRAQNAIADKRVASLNGRLVKLQLKQKELESANDKVGAAKNWEAKEKEAKIRELREARAEMESKRYQMDRLGGETDKLRADITELKDKLRNLRHEQTVAEEVYSKPTLKDTVLQEAARIGPIPVRLVNKTVESLVPDLNYGLKEVQMVRKEVQEASAWASIITTLSIYGLGISTMCIVYRCLRKLQRHLTVPRMLFTIDMAFAAVWVLVSCCYILILEDPLVVMATDYTALSIVVQVTVMLALIGNVLLRCFQFSVSTCSSTFLELVCSVFIAHDYFQAIWVPSLFDQEFKSSFATYFCFLFLHGCLGITRARSVGRLIEDCDKSMGKDIEFKGKQWLVQKMENTRKYFEALLSMGMSAIEKELGHSAKRKSAKGRGRKTRPRRKSYRSPSVDLFAANSDMDHRK